MKKSIIRYSYACLAQDGLCNHPKGSYVSYRGRTKTRASRVNSKKCPIFQQQRMFASSVPKEGRNDVVRHRFCNENICPSCPSFRPGRTIPPKSCGMPLTSGGFRGVQSGATAPPPFMMKTRLGAPFSVRRAPLILTKMHSFFRVSF